MKKYRKILSVLCCVALLWGLMSSTVFAEEEKVAGVQLFLSNYELGGNIYDLTLALHLEESAPEIAFESDEYFDMFVLTTSNNSLDDALDHIISDREAVLEADTDYYLMFALVPAEADDPTQAPADLVMNEDDITLDGQSPVSFYDGKFGVSYYSVFKLPVLTNHTHSIDEEGDYQYDEENHWRECTDEDCPDKEGSITDLEEHSMETVIDKEATETEDGQQHEECSVRGCGYKTEPQVIPATGTPDDDETGDDENKDTDSVPKDDTPQTGDSLNLVVLLALAAAALGSLGICVRKKRV